MVLVIITACQAGVAHSKMCASALKNEAEKRGHTVYTEMQGGSNLTQLLPEAICQSADVILIAYAIAVSGKERFSGKKTISIPIDQAIRNVKAVIDKVEEVHGAP